MSNLIDMPLDTKLQVGDIVTVTGPGEHDVLVREVTELAATGGAVVRGLYASFTNVSSLLRQHSRTLTRVQRPVPFLPTVEGTYIIEVNAESRIVRQLTDGSWRNQDDCNLPACELIAKVGAGATLTRVIPADEVKHPAVDMDKAQKAFAAANKPSFDEDFAVTLRRVLKGEFDL